MSNKPLQLSECIANILSDCIVYAFVLLSFIFFVMWNGSIVVGDKEQHIATVHLAQIGYFCLFFLLFSLPYGLECVKPFYFYCKKKPLILISWLCLFVFIVHCNTLVHPFMLADNRHYTFYIWNRFYGRYAWFRYAIIPLYVFGGYVLYNFIRGNSFAFKALYVVASCLCFVPQKLIEPRYFILPFLVARLQSISNRWTTICLETVYYLCINIIVLYIFTNKTFHWDDFEEPQRVMW